MRTYRLYARDAFDTVPNTPAITVTGDKHAFGIDNGFSVFKGDELVAHMPCGSYGGVQID